MKNLTSFIQLFVIAIFCFATANLKAQVVNAAGTFQTTTNEYESAATAGYGNWTVVVFQKPTNEIRLASYLVLSNGTINNEYDVLDFGSAKKVNVVMLSETRAAVSYISTTNQHRVAIFDLNTTTGDLTLKNEWAGPGNVTVFKPGIARLSNSSFATAIGLSNSALRITSFTVAANGTITKKDDDDNGGVQAADLTRMSNGRVVASVHLTATSAKAICFDVNETTQVITRRGDVSLGSDVKRLSSVAFAQNMLAVFSVDGNDRLDARSYNVNNSGNFILKSNLSDLKHTVTGQFYQIRSLDGQNMSSAGKMLLGTVSTEGAGSKLGVIPFNYNTGTGIITLLSGGYYPNNPQFNYIYAGAANGRVVLSARLMTNKYQIRAYQWGN